MSGRYSVRQMYFRDGDGDLHPMGEWGIEDSASEAVLLRTKALGAAILAAWALNQADGAVPPWEQVRAAVQVHKEPTS